MLVTKERSIIWCQWKYRYWVISTAIWNIWVWYRYGSKTYRCQIFKRILVTLLTIDIFMWLMKMKICLPARSKDELFQQILANFCSSSNESEFNSNLSCNSGKLLSRYCSTIYEYVKNETGAENPWHLVDQRLPDRGRRFQFNTISFVMFPILMFLLLLCCLITFFLF